MSLDQRDTAHVWLDTARQGLDTGQCWLRPRLPLVVACLLWLVAQALAYLARASRSVERALARDWTTAHRTMDHLSQLASRGSGHAQEALCRRVIERDDRLAQQLALGSGYAPRDPTQRALFAFLTEQWEMYEGVDFEASLLRAAYPSLSTDQRRRLAEAAQRARRGAWVGLATGGRELRRLSQLTNAEWQAILAILAEQQRWEEVWRLAQAAPLVWAARLLVRLRAAEWLPSDEEARAAVHELGQLAQRCDADAPLPGRLMRCQAVLRHTSAGRSTLSSLAISPDGALLASACSDGSVQLWQLPDGTPAGRLTGHTGWVHALAISPDGRLLASGGSDRTVRLWRLPDGAPLATLAGHTAGTSGRGVFRLAISPDGQWLASAAEDGAVRVWRLPDGALLHAAARNGAECLAITPDAGLLLIGGGWLNGAFPVQAWHLRTGTPRPPTCVHTKLVRDLAISPSGALLATASDDRHVRLWRLPSGAPVAELAGHRASVSHLAISPTSTLLVSGDTGGQLRLWQLPEGQSLGRLAGHPDPVRCLEISPDGTFLATGSCPALPSTARDHAVRLWRLPDGAPLGTLDGHTGPITALAISPDGLLVASGSIDDTVCLWSSELLRLSRLPVAQLGFDELAWAEQAMREGAAGERERGWLELLVALVRRQRRHDIVLRDPTAVPITAGPYDIALDGRGNPLLEVR